MRRRADPGIRTVPVEFGSHRLEKMDEFVAAAPNDCRRRCEGPDLPAPHQDAQRDGGIGAVGTRNQWPRLHNNVDAWVGMLIAPVSHETRAVIADPGRE